MQLDGQVAIITGGSKELESFLLESLERVGAGTWLESTSPQSLGTGFLDDTG